MEFDEITNMIATRLMQAGVQTGDRIFTRITQRTNRQNPSSDTAKLDNCLN
ncbi:hypothetical protein [Fischerella sp. JS2]|uniref:hypothetical protein n=1 Tax=Fischerella sp. JS2 TaxID=2597771 RepID=UPI0028E897C8|nr:hypothetical protein [Fischerella sp. JS2]